MFLYLYMYYYYVFISFIMYYYYFSFHVSYIYIRILYLYTPKNENGRDNKKYILYDYYDIINIVDSDLHKHMILTRVWCQE